MRAAQVMHRDDVGPLAVQKALDEDVDLADAFRADQVVRF
jgi:hypothetical protein